MLINRNRHVIVQRHFRPNKDTFPFFVEKDLNIKLDHGHVIYLFSFSFQFSVCFFFFLFLLFSLPFNHHLHHRHIPYFIVHIFSFFFFSFSFSSPNFCGSLCSFVSLSSVHLGCVYVCLSIMCSNFQ